MTDTNGWSKSELYVMKKLDELQASMDLITNKLSHLSCAVHTERMQTMQDMLGSHDKDINKIKGWRSQILGAVAVLVIVGQLIWSKVAKLIFGG